MSDQDAVYRAICDTYYAASQNAYACAIDVAVAAMRPSVLYRPDLSRDGDQWCALYGENLHAGVSGFGSTPEAAMEAFDKAWRGES